MLPAVLLYIKMKFLLSCLLSMRNTRIVMLLVAEQQKIRRRDRGGKFWLGVRGYGSPRAGQEGPGKDEDKNDE